MRDLGYNFDGENRTNRIYYNKQTGARAIIPRRDSVDEKNLGTILYQAGLPKAKVDEIVASIKAESEKGRTETKKK